MSLTNQELQIMRVVWQRGDTTVRDVYEEMRKRRRIAYTTVMTMMNILERKGRLMKRKSGRAFNYAPVGSKDQVLQEMLIEFIDRVFEGSVPAFRRAMTIARKGH
jgi:BlaI family penicillinase repressor